MEHPDLRRTQRLVFAFRLFQLGIEIFHLGQRFASRLRSKEKPAPTVRPRKGMPGSGRSDLPVLVRVDALQHNVTRGIGLPASSPSLPAAAPVDKSNVTSTPVIEARPSAEYEIASPGNLWAPALNISGVAGNVLQNRPLSR